MSTLSFPSNPSTNDTYSFGGKTWIWNGTAWNLQDDGAINGIVIGNSVPSAGTFTTLGATTLDVQTGVASNLIPTANVTYDLGNTTNRWNELYLAGSSIYFGNVVMKNTTGNTVEFFDADGNTPAAISEQNVDTTTIAHGNTSMGIPDTGGNIVANVDGVVVATIHSTGMTVEGDTTSMFFVSPRTISANTTIGNINATSTGPIIIADGVTVTISSGGEWNIA